MKRILTMALMVLAATACLAAETDRVLPEGQLPPDSRLGKPKDLNAYFPFAPPATKAAWEQRRQELREQVLLANGLWPMPPRTPLNPVIHGKIDRDDYTVEKVFFASHPGHYVCGNLYRPKSPRSADRGRPGVLCPHGHWSNGRFFEASDKAVEKEISSGAEKSKEGARYPLQARCAMLARMGCVVFHYDMVGYADSQQFKHRVGFTDAEAELRQQNFMGLQTWNSIRALDFILGLPDVDANRIAVTGASGGGTQTFLLCAVDDRPAVAFPAVMVSTAMQGGCVCENCSYLRVDSGNIELAGLFAPKPLAMSAANDWTKEMETKGLPELKKLYGLYGKEDLVTAKHYPFPHNYNQVSREMMYNWFNRHLKLGQPEPVIEKPFTPVPPKELAVYNAEHPLPKDAKSPDELRKYLTDVSEKQLAGLLPKDAAGLKEYRRVIGTALRVMVNDKLPEASDVEEKNASESKDVEGISWRKSLLGRKGKDEAVPAILAIPPGHNGTVVVWIHPDGKRSLWQDGKLTAAARQVLNQKSAILAIDALLTGESAAAKPPPVNAGYAGFTFGYNRSLLANRVHDVLTAVAHARGRKDTKSVHLAGFDAAGPWVALARGMCGDAVARTAADLNGFRFEQVDATSHPMMLPGAAKYGGLPALAGLSAPGPFFVHNTDGTGVERWLGPVYKTAGAAERLQQTKEQVAAQKVVEWILK